MQVTEGFRHTQLTLTYSDLCFQRILPVAVWKQVRGTRTENRSLFWEALNLAVRVKVMVSTTKYRDSFTELDPKRLIPIWVLRMLE